MPVFWTSRMLSCNLLNCHGLIVNKFMNFTPFIILVFHEFYSKFDSTCSKYALAHFYRKSACHLIGEEVGFYHRTYILQLEIEEVQTVLYKL